MVHVQRWLIGLAATLVAYLGYAIAVAPWLEPPPLTPRAPAPRPTLTTRKEHDFRHLFPPGSWQLNNPKVIETESGLLLLNDYQPLPDGKLEVTPCTVILFAGKGEEAQRRPLVLDAPAGAVVQFDRELDLANAKIGELVGGKLPGDIRIFRPASQPGAADGLELTTRNVQIERQRVWTPHEVQFHYGPSYGSGRDLSIHLLPPDAVLKSNASAFGNLQRLQLGVVDVIHVEPAALPLAALSNGEPAPAAAASPLPTTPKTTDLAPVEVRCRGPFQFDFLEQVASFNEDVVVTQIHPRGQPDNLRCQRLAMRMRKDVAPAGNAPPTTNATGKPANAHAAGNLASVEATGDEVIVDAPSQQMYASAARIAYDFEHERLSVTPGPRTPRVTLRHQRQQLVARQLEYEPAPQGGLGKAWAEGPGTATLEQMVGMGVQQFQVDWAKDLRLLPQDGMHVLTIREQARVSSPSWGTFTAGELFVWLKENAAPVVRQPSAAGGLNVGNLEPDRLLASGRVTVDTPQMTGETERFEAWFRQATPPVTNLPAAVPDRTVPIVPQPGPPTTAPSTTPLSPPADAGPDLIPARPASLGAFARPSPSVSTPVSSPSQPIRAPDVAPLPAFPNQATAEALAPTAPLQRFHVTGKLVRARLVRHPAETTMEDLAVEGNVRIVETQTAEPNAIPAEIAGDIVQLQNGYSNEALLQVVGQPAVVNARGMRLAGASIKLHRGENRAWIDGPGEAEALVSRALFAPPGAPQVARPSDAANGKDEKPQVARLSWQGGAKFDGQTLIVSKQVLARTEKDLQILTADSLTVTLDHFVDFQRSNLERTPQVATLRVDGGVKLQNRSLDEAGQLLSAEQFEIRNFSIDQRTGRLEGEGPGYLSSKRTGGVALAGAGFPAPAAAATGNAKLMSVLITFQGNLVGNISQREIQFQRQVRTALGPIAQWDDKFDPRSAEELGEQGVVLTSDKLTAAEMRLPALGQSWMELEASGNALVEGKLFTASAQRLAYSTGKEMLVVEGDGRTDAELWYRPGPGQPRAYQAARKIMYWRKTNAIEVSDAKAIDLDQLTIPSLPGISGLRRP